MDMQSPSSSISYGFKYQVFLSFRGSDTRYGLTGNLYKALTDKGIHTFIDDRELQKGDEITPSLVKAIKESRIFIPVFSTNYASSSFCLDELVHIIHCYKETGRLILPLFVGVDPTNVRHHRGSYGEALAEHERKFQNDKDNMERLQRWKVALSQAANLSGYHFSHGYEYEFIEKIVKEIFDKINCVLLHVAKYPVGLQSRVEEVKLLLDKESDQEVHMVGLYGIGGLGKSTLAKAIYNFVADQFEGVCFLHKVRENSTHNNLKHLQEELLLKTVKLSIKLGDVSEGIPLIKERLSRKKILLILDDVDKLEQLEALAGGLDWFGRGSRVIITTRDKHLLTCRGIERTYAVKGLYGTEALELLRWMAFKNGEVPSSYKDILNRAVAYASGLPLVLEIVGSNLFGKSIDEWKYTLDGYEKIPNKEIQKILKVSYDALEEEEQSVFLDIACCFTGCYWPAVKNILKAHYGRCIKHHVGVLAEKSLIYQYDVRVTLHDLIEDMGRALVRQESPKEPGERSRLWCHDDIIHVLKENTGTSKVEMIHLNCPSTESVIDWNGKAFKKMKKLKTLIIENGHFSKGPKYLSSGFRVLKWKGCPSKSLSSCFLNKKFENMKVLELNYCEYLTCIPNVSGLPNLENLSFEKCNNLITIHNSIGYLNKLETLIANYCSKLESFPPLQLASLKKLELYECLSLKSFPELLCKMTNIKEIRLCETSIRELPFSFQNFCELRDLIICQDEMLRFSSKMELSKLSKITASYCHFLLPNHNFDYSMFSNVEHLNLKYNNFSDECLPLLLKWCVNVRYLDLWGSNLKILPECLNECHLLRVLSLNRCEYLEEIRGIPPNLERLSARRCESLSSSSRRILLSQKLHEAGCTYIHFPNGREGIPDCFQHQITGQTISFWFRKKIPSIRAILILGLLRNDLVSVRVNLFVNGYEYYLIRCCPFCIESNHTCLFDLRLEENIKLYNLDYPAKLVCELDEALLKNEWIHVEIKLMIHEYVSAEMGIHVLKEKSDTEENVIFSSRYRKRKLDEYLNYSNSSLSQFEPPLKKQIFVEEIFVLTGKEISQTKSP